MSEAVAALQLDEPVVIRVARGGVAVAVEVARVLEAPLTAIDVERVNASGLRLGAVIAHGPPYLREENSVPEEDVPMATSLATAQTTQQPNPRLVDKNARALCGDTIIGCPGQDDLYGGGGEDRLLSADGEIDRLDCGDRLDSVVADRFDSVSRNCERVRRKP